MSLEEVAQGFAALGSEARLAVVLCLVKAGTGGLTIGDIQERTGMAPSTLAHHLRFLSQGGLILQEKQGRSVVNRASFDHLAALGGYLLKECCADEQKCGETEHGDDQ
ncbi:helix-turn-helix transcriptional regulator [Roseibium sp. CAU 1637]|uniref:Helix-turn-helix transcriptional regulator n=1 Tax=Roseibium limicola TaxID=2816037 RepID=A0A939EJF6_9HYPH|nr:metalloregulator ArsR/SmtB family transcription factor [Roseibium limicola]MBO0343765.1 helix-turn-helix transcriptional regulator [Roseibium limicola]